MHVTEDKILRISVDYDGEIIIYFGSRTNSHRGVYMLQGAWDEMEKLIKSLDSKRLTDPCRLEGTDIYLQEKAYQNQIVLDIRKRRHGKGADYHILHCTPQGVTLQMTTIRKHLVGLFPEMRDCIQELSRASVTLSTVKEISLKMITSDRKKSWCDGCELDDPSQYHHECLTLGPDLFNPLFQSWSEWVNFRVMSRLEDINIDELIQGVKERTSTSESLIKESLQFLQKYVEKFARETEEFLLKKDSYVLSGEIVAIE